jgi:uncharacterized protein (TIGR02246 family)
MAPVEQIQLLYLHLINAWNERDAKKMSSLFEEDGEMVGFDGSYVGKQKNIFEHLNDIFQHHLTPPFTVIIKDIRFPNEGIALLHAVVGMVSQNEDKINPDLNAIQTLVAICKEEKWRITHFQNTPAAFHGRPELVEQMTIELENERNKK